MRTRPFAAMALLAAFVSWSAAPTVARDSAVVAIDVALDRPGAAIPSTLFGIFYEDINFAADGGLYPERVKNGSFEFPDPLMGWKKAVPAGGRFEVRTDGAAKPSNPHYLRVETTGASSFGVLNDGFRGIGIAQGQEYEITLLARQSGSIPTSLVVKLQDRRGGELGSVRIEGIGGTWSARRAVLRASRTDARAQLAVIVDAGAVDLDLVSLFPVDTYKGRPHGLRKDLGEMLEQLHPGFLRFPGGCIVEGRYLDTRYQWKNTIGEVGDRRLIVNRWNDEFANKPAPDYYQSFGLGFFEYFQLAEDLGAEPLPILNCGMACQYNSGELAPVEALDAYIQDALDLIEFANGPVTSTWGGKRAALGHPAPFRMTLLGVGNEQWGPQYLERYKRFREVLKGRHPEVKLVASADPAFRSANFEEQWRGLRALGADYVDEHFYQPPAWFLQQATRYDAYPRTGPKVFAGEYAAHVRPPGRGENRNVWEAAIAEAAFMTGLERNADVVEMASYAPLLAHVDAWQWSPNLIWFDNLQAYGTPNYYVQQLFGANRGTRIVPVTIDGGVVAGRDGLFASGALDEPTGDIVLKIVNSGDRPASLRLRGPGLPDGTARTWLMTAEPGAENSLAEPTKVAPVAGATPIAHGSLVTPAPARSLLVLRIRARG